MGKIIKLKESLTWYEVENFLTKHKKISLCGIEYFTTNLTEMETYWIPETYGEYSSFGFIWDGRLRVKVKEKKDSKHKAIVKVKIDVNNSNNSKEK